MLLSNADWQAVGISLQLAGLSTALLLLIGLPLAIWRVRRVNEWTEHVKQRTGFELLANRHRVAETGVILRRKQEADAQVIQRFAGTLGVHIEVNTECGEQIGRT